MSVVNGDIIEENGVKIIITRTNRQKGYYLDFENCENKIKSEYGIAFNDSLYLLQIEIDQDGMTTPSFFYELYYN